MVSGERCGASKLSVYRSPFSKRSALGAICFAVKEVNLQLTTANRRSNDLQGHPGPN